MSAATTSQRRFSTLDALLARHRRLWQVRPFHSRNLGWDTEEPGLSQALLALDDASLTELELDERRLEHWLQPWLGNDAGALRGLAELTPLPRRSLAIPPRLDTGMPGRKRDQILAFAAVLPAGPEPVLEWCAGKGHLGRLLAAVDGRRVTSLEWNGALCRAGSAEAERRNLAVTFIEADALDPGSGNHLPPGGQALALHACGDLHTRLVAHWSASDCRRLSFSPCCYHLTAETFYRPLSAVGRASALRLDKVDLKLPTRETVTGGRGAVRRRRTELLWRLAFDEWQRRQRCVDRYLPLPTIPGHLLSASFTAFCSWAVATRGLPLTTPLDEAEWLELGERRLALVRRTELVSHWFRRPLEVWLALDLVLFLEEHGARVRLGTFCDKPLTPRNILIDAERVGDCV